VEPAGDRHYILLQCTSHPIATYKSVIEVLCYVLKQK